MNLLESLGILFSFAALSGWLNKRYIKLPSAIGVMTVSLVFSLALIAVERLGAIDLSFTSILLSSFDFEALFLHGMLAFLLFAAGLSVNLEDLYLQKGVISVLATVGVFLATCSTGVLFWLGLGWLGIEIPFLIALVFGSIIAPTDPVAVLGILRKVGVPKSLETKVVGESLFNDGVGVVVFIAITSFAFGHGITVSDVLIRLMVEVFGGVALGALLGWLVYIMLKAVNDHAVEILLTLALAAGGYALAEALHMSAPICAVVSGLIIGNQGRAIAMSQETREHLDTFWELVDELLNAILFALVGLEIIALSISPSYVTAGLMGIATVLVSRFISVGLPICIMRRWRSFSPHVIKILSWGGLKGGISIALALSLPANEYHDLLLLSTYIVVLFSVLIQGSTLSLLLAFAKRRAKKATTA